MTAEDKHKHLEFAQGIINRMGQNSFLLKGWTITLVAALFALAAKDSKSSFFIVAYFPSTIFWLLDSYYLYQERLFRKVYDDIRNDASINFSLSTKKFDNGVIDFAKAAFSKTIILFYGSIITTLLIIIFTLNK